MNSFIMAAFTSGVSWLDAILGTEWAVCMRHDGKRKKKKYFKPRAHTEPMSEGESNVSQ